VLADEPINQVPVPDINWALNHTIGIPGHNKRRKEPVLERPSPEELREKEATAKATNRCFIKSSLSNFFKIIYELRSCPESVARVKIFNRLASRKADGQMKVPKSRSCSNFEDLSVRVNPSCMPLRL
jgi:hypothetical protein